MKAFHQRSLLMSLLLAMTISACSGDGGDPAGAGDKAQLSGASAMTRDYQRQDSPVVAVPDGGGWLATQAIVLSNDSAGATRAQVQLVTSVGDVTSSPGANGYQITVSLQASGNSESEARAALASMSLSHGDELGGDLLSLDTRVAFAPYQAPSSGGIVTDLRRASIHASLPAALVYALRQHTDVGDADAAGLSGVTAQLDTQVGNAQLQGDFERVSLDCETGQVSYTGDTRQLHAYTSVGSVIATIPASADLLAELGTQIGDVQVGLPVAAAGAGFDLVASTEVGAAAIVVRNTESQGASSATHAHYRSADYDSASPKIRVYGTSQVGDVIIRD